MKNKIYIILVTIIVVFLTILFIVKLRLNSYINNHIKYEDINMTTNIILSISTKDEKSEVQYRLQKSNSVYKLNYDQYNNNNQIFAIEKYYIDNDEIYEYTYNNKIWNKKKVSKIDKIFNVDYKKLKKSLNMISYKGIEDNKYKIYKAKIKAYDAYNFIYSKDILTKKDNMNFVDIIIYIDKTNNFIYKIECDIPNISNQENEHSKANYKFEIINTNINSDQIITLPFKK